jgi:hypothetical protein
MRNFAVAVLLTTLFAAGVPAQKQATPWSEWSSKDAEKMLSDSPWGQTQVETNTSEMTYSPTSGKGSTGTRTTRISTSSIRNDQSDVNTNRSREGAYNQAVDIKYRIRFLSARPIREAFAKMIVGQQAGADSGDPPQTSEKLKRQMQEFVDRDYGAYIVVAVGYDASDQRLSGKAFQEFSSAVAGTLKNNTYLERSDGQRIFLMDYRAPIQDGLGAKFVFPRMLDGQPFLKSASGELRFYSEVGPKTTLNLRFTVSDMVYRGKLEY